MSYIFFVVLPFLVAVGAFLDDDAASLQVELTAMKAEMTKLQQTITSMQAQLSMSFLCFTSISSRSIISQSVGKHNSKAFQTPTAGTYIYK